MSSGPIPERLGALKLKTDATERWCDVAAEKLNSIVFGLPVHHCLRCDAAASLPALRKQFDQLQRRLRKADPREIELLDPDPDEERGMLLIPEFPTLDAPATAADVAAGRAVFHLGGKGKLTDKKLPLVGELRPAGKAKTGERVLIVQAEANAAGAITYGVIARYAIRAMPASAFVHVAPLDAKAWQPRP